MPAGDPSPTRHWCPRFLKTDTSCRRGRGPGRGTPGSASTQTRGREPRKEPPGAESERRRARGRPHSRGAGRSEEHTSELQSRLHLVCRLLLEKKKKKTKKQKTVS